MTILRHRSALLTWMFALGALTCLVSAPPAAADATADRVESWLSNIVRPLAKAGYRLSWDEIVSHPVQGDVTVRGLRGTESDGRPRLFVASLSLTGPAVAAGGGLTAEALVLHAIEMRGGRKTDILTAGQLTIEQPDLAVVLDLLTASLSDVRDDLGDREIWSRVVAGGLEVRDLEAKGTARDGPLEVRFERFFTSGVDTDRLERLEIDDLIMASAEADGDLVTLSIDRVRASDISAGRAWDTVASDPDSVRPLSALAALHIGSIEIEGFRSQAALAGTTRIARQWARTRAYQPGQSGILEYGAEGVTSSHDQPDNPVAPFLLALFPPDGVVPVAWSGDLSYDVDDGFVGLRQQMAVERFGSLDLRIDFGGVPDLTAQEWRTIEKSDPRLAALQINGLSLSITDTGGGDRTVLAMSDDKTVPAHVLRDAFAAQVGAIAQSFGGEADPRLAAWVRVIEDFVRSGGTLAFGVTLPVPVGTVAEEADKGEGFAELAERYGLVVTRR